MSSTFKLIHYLQNCVLTATGSQLPKWWGIPEVEPLPANYVTRKDRRKCIKTYPFGEHSWTQLFPLGPFSGRMNSWKWRAIQIYETKMRYGTWRKIITRPKVVSISILTYFQDITLSRLITIGEAAMLYLPYFPAFKTHFFFDFWNLKSRLRLICGYKSQKTVKNAIFCNNLETHQKQHLKVLFNWKLF